MTDVSSGVKRPLPEEQAHAVVTKKRHATAPEVDCVFQMNHQSHALRLKQYFDDDVMRSIVFPKLAEGDRRCAESLENLGFAGGVHLEGTYLVLLRKIVGDPSEWVEWMYSSFLQHVVSRMYFLDANDDGKEGPRSPDALVQSMIDRYGSSGEVNGPIRLQCCPRKLEMTLLGMFEKMGKDNPFEFHPVTYSHVCQIVLLPDGYFRFCMRSSKDAFHTRPDGDSRIPGQFCRAAGKLHEALLVTGFLEECQSDASGIAIDVGAAPGGWTHQLARCMKTVIAIDPAELHPSVISLENVHHIKKKSQDAGEDIDAIVKSNAVSLVCCDANRHPFAIGDMLRPAIKYLKVGGLLILTLKFKGRGESEFKKSVQELSDKFFGDAEGSGSWGGMQVIFLMANTKFERTVVARKV
jgi:23S rRNA U2552 (ribose-2'-O)-methylase RlmE/FtsJ